MPKAQKDKVGHYLQQIKRAKTHKDFLRNEYEWDNLRNTINTAGLYVEDQSGVWHQVEQDHTASGYVNWPWAFKESFIPAVYSQQPELYVYPRRSMYAESAKMVQAVVNATLEAIGFERETKRALLDSIVYGHGWVKVGWYTRFGQLPAGQGVQPKRGQTSDIDIDMDLAYDAPYAYRVSPEMMHVDPDATRYEDIRWVAQEYFLPFEKVKEDDLLKYTEDATPLGNDGEHPESKSIFKSGSQDAEKDKWARLYEIWDREEENIYVLIEGCDKFSRTVKGWPYRNIRGFPFKFLTLNDAVDKLFPPSPILAWYPLVSELGQIRRTRMEHMNKMVNKIYGEQGAIEDDQIEKLGDPSCDYFEVMDIDKVGNFKGLQPDANLYACEEKIEENIREVSGFSELISGSVPYSKLTATTSQIAAQHSTIRFRHATLVMSEFIKECAKDLFYILRDYQDRPMVVRVSDNPRADLQEVTPDQMKGEFDFRVLVEDMSHISKAERVKAAYDELVALAPFKEVRRETLIRKFLEANGHVNIDEFMHPPMGPPLDPQYENSLMSRGIPVKVNPNEDFELHLRVHNEWISSPAYQQLVAQVPAIQQMVSAHIQETTRAFEERQAEGGGGRPQAGVSSQTQQGRRMNSSTPQGGASNQRGPAGGMSQLADMLRGGQ